MDNHFAISDVFLNATAQITPRNAVAAIILNDEGRVLLQLRDDKPDIFFPNHWSCFGGAMEPDESPLETLHRELEEELGMTFKETAVEPFIKIAFNPTVASKNIIDRHFFIVRMPSAQIKNIKLGEGQAFDFFTFAGVMRLANITPYDKFGLWLYFSQNRIVEYSQ